jgi:hypothetical protein
VLILGTRFVHLIQTAHKTILGMFAPHYCTMKTLLLPGFFVFILLAFSAGRVINPNTNDKKYETACIGFYNVENLYDTINDPNKQDEEFLPEGANQWTGDRYVKKLDRLAEVISQLGTEFTPNGVSVMGLCEIENKSVLEDLVKREKIAKRNYKVILHDGPDRRGVDVALLYNPAHFELTHYTTYALNIPGDSGFATREQLVVSGKLFKDPITCIVAHWPSRRGGEKASRPKRAAAAQLGRKIIDSLFHVNPNAKIVYMGDLNDDPVNASVKTGLRASGKITDTTGNKMFNPMAELFQKGVGSLAYNDAWNLFDQTIISPALIKKDFSSFRYLGAKVYNKEYLMQKDGRFEGYLWRTYVGTTYTGGYSDHFPVYLLLGRNPSN